MAAQKAAPVKKVTPKAAPQAAKPQEEKKKKPVIYVNAKLANPESILKKYDELITQLSTVESSQRNKNKPYRIYFMHRKRMEVMKMNFIKSMR